MLLLWTALMLHKDNLNHHLCSTWIIQRLVVSISSLSRHKPLGGKQSERQSIRPRVTSGLDQYELHGLARQRCLRFEVKTDEDKKNNNRFRSHLKHRLMRLVVFISKEWRWKSWSVSVLCLSCSISSSEHWCFCFLPLSVLFVKQTRKQGRFEATAWMFLGNLLNKREWTVLWYQRVLYSLNNLFCLAWVF